MKTSNNNRQRWKYEEGKATAILWLELNTNSYGAFVSQDASRPHTNPLTRCLQSSQSIHSVRVAALHIFVTARRDRQRLASTPTIVLLNVDYELFFYVNNRVLILFIEHRIAADCNRIDVDDQAIRYEPIPYHFISGSLFFFMHRQTMVILLILVCYAIRLCCSFRFDAFQLACAVCRRHKCLHWNIVCIESESTSQYVSIALTMTGQNGRKWKKNKKKSKSFVWFCYACVCLLAHTVAGGVVRE